MECDLGHLVYYSNDTLPVNVSSSEELKNLATNFVQKLANKLWELPVEKVDGVVVAQLTASTIRLPREKPCPKPTMETKWEKFARAKGIVKKKKGRLEWNDELRQWTPKWGYKSKNNEKDWLLEVPANADPFEDQYAKKAHERKEKIAKNELQRLRNLSRNSKGKVMGVGMMPVPAKENKSDIDRRMSAAMKSTASMGDFDEKLSEEKKIKIGKKRKFESNTGDADTERDKNLSLIKKIKDNKPLVNKDKAANFEQVERETKRAAKRKAEGGEKREWKNKNKTQKKQRGTSKHSMQKRKK